MKTLILTILMAATSVQAQQDGGCGTPSNPCDTIIMQVSPDTGIQQIMQNNTDNGFTGVRCNQGHPLSPEPRICCQYVNGKKQTCWMP